MTQAPQQLWEILVPTERMDDHGKMVPCRTRYHKVWDEHVKQISGGLTILHPVKGEWMYEGKLYQDRVIPVRIICTRQQIEAIIHFTIGYYGQLAVMAYKISDEVLLIHAAHLK